MLTPGSFFSNQARGLLRDLRPRNAALTKTIHHSQESHLPRKLFGVIHGDPQPVGLHVPKIFWIFGSKGEQKEASNVWLTAGLHLLTILLKLKMGQEA